MLADKIQKNESIAKTFLEDYRETDLCGYRTEPEQRMLLIPRPAGVVFGITPSTSPVAAVAFKVLCALLTRNAIVISPHPGARGVSSETALLLAKAATAAGAPADAVQVVTEPSIPLVEAMMADARTTLVIATGGSGVVRAAYRSGTPAIGVGPGNAPVIVDETVELKGVVEKLVRSKTFDGGVLCTTESVLIAVDAVAPRLLKLLAANGAYLCSGPETAQIREHMYPGGRFNTAVVGRPAVEIAAAAGVTVPAATTILLTPIDSVSASEPLTHEKLSPVLAFRTAPTFERALADARAILDVVGVGHSAVLHSDDPQRVLDFAETLPVHRIAVNAPGSLGNAGFGTNLPVSMSLGTGYIGGSSSSENLNPEHFVQWSRVAYSTNIFERFPDFTGITPSIAPPQRSVLPKQLPLPSSSAQPNAVPALDDLRRIVQDELRNLIGTR